MPHQKALAWTPWISGATSRNLARMGGGVDQTVRSLHRGAQAIVDAIRALPLTRHEVANGPAERFVLDAFPVAHGKDGMGLMISVHGQFIEGLCTSFVEMPGPDQFYNN
jgi:nuclear RNA export factor